MKKECHVIQLQLFIKISDHSILMISSSDEAFAHLVEDMLNLIRDPVRLHSNSTSKLLKYRIRYG